jgi:predicted phage tail protein
MLTPGPLRASKREPIPIDARAADHLRYIRETMASAAEFTAVPGWGGVAMGISALAAAYVASRQPTPRAWLAVWLVEALIAVAIAAPAAATKAHRANSRLFSGPGRKFVLSFAPPVVVGGLLTFALYQAGAFSILPGVWLLLYGTAIVTGGAFSVRVVPVMGLCLMMLGAAALLAPAAWGDAFMATGFGIVQIGFGCWIARHYGG